MLVRLQKYLAECGIASRRKSEELILQGKVSVNGVVVSEVGTKIDDEKDIVEYLGKQVEKETNTVYILLNKPIRICNNCKRTISKRFNYGFG